MRKYGKSLLDNMKEGLIKKRTKGFKKLRADRYYNENLLTKIIYAWKERINKKSMKQYQIVKAQRYYCV